MTPTEFRAIRLKLGLSCQKMARALGLSHDHGGRHIRKIEAGKVKVSGPISKLMERFLAETK